jgi:hypothetical protein
MSTTDAVAFWNGVYAARPAASSPQPNARLTETVTGLPPGDALDLGCGEGGDALWLARLGWHVTAVDISAMAVERLAALARAPTPSPTPGAPRRPRPRPIRPRLRPPTRAAPPQRRRRRRPRPRSTTTRRWDSARPTNTTRRTSPSPPCATPAPTTGPSPSRSASAAPNSSIASATSRSGPATGRAPRPGRRTAGISPGRGPSSVQLAAPALTSCRAVGTRAPAVRPRATGRR